MRIDLKTFPVWEWLENPTKENIIGKLHLDECLLLDVGTSVEDLLEFQDGLQGVLAQVKTKYYVTEPFEQALFKALPKIQTKYTTIDPKSDCGVLIAAGGCTAYLASPGDSLIKLLVYGFTKDRLTCYAIVLPNNKIIGSYRTLQKTGIGPSEKTEVVQDNAKMAEWCNSVMAVLYFINNCEIETKTVKAGEKLRDKKIHKNNHTNDTKSDITVLDCTWFTELVRVTETTVNGFFRWQPHGPKSTLRKLKWIKEFKKKPYTRRAKKEIQNES